ncbi:MAG TPA: TonB family protein [Longimicrobium sp.]
MSRPPLAIAAVLVLAGAAGACAPQCTCPAAIPAPTAGPPPAATPMPAPPPAAVPAAPQPAAAPAPAPAPAQAPAAAPAPGPLRLLNEGPAVRRMRSAYPAHLLAAGTRGDVVVEVTLDENGRVQSAMDVQANNDQFRGPALTIAQELRFSTPPAAGATVRVRLRFQPAGSRIDVVP